ncbi:tRNA pseudouridine(38-40) synthase TruA [Robertkochia aurantiaca]|uniref:tRNA pseudouridine(38-40) synthase TruA n=1 Tax=Robertkochia aurantiaca TaxID=2873700 RepID=UPI001CCC4452|nr:tRNA pseudouridine(38-40) synthase TruA [Robertkochia sp. 3YJGBD-33]
MRYFAELSYRGTAYHGWQVQPKDVSVQEIIEKALSTLLRTDISITGAGRTDAGVHARQMYAHFDLETPPDLSDLVYRLNAFLPADIAIHEIYRVHDEAHARFDAVSRSYEYHIISRKDPFAIDQAWYHRQETDVKKMNQAAALLLQYEDFECFSRSKTDVKTYICKVSRAEWEVTGNRLVFHISADRFLRNMVRAVVGTLMEIGTGRMEVSELHRIIESRDRREAGASVPAHGLYLTKVEYPKTIFQHS